MKGLLGAIAFLTRLPVGNLLAGENPGKSGTLPWYGVVGLVIGLLLALAGALANQWLGQHDVVTAVVVLLAWVALTGALHLDGLADCGDAWMSGQGGERMLEIMRDTHCGVGAIVAVTGVLLFKFAGLWTLVEAGEFLALAIAAPAARIGLTAVLVYRPYIRDAGLGTGLADEVNGRDCLVYSLVLVLLVAMMSTAALVAAAAGVVIGWLAVEWTLVRRTGGYTGDIYGALVEVAECGVLLGLVMLV